MLFMEQNIVSPNRHNNVLDLCFTNNVEIIDNVRISPAIFSDYNIIEITMYCPE